MLQYQVTAIMVSSHHEERGRLRQWLVADGHEVFLNRDLRDGILGSM